MAATIKLDTREFAAAIQAYKATTRKDIADILNQRALNIAYRAVDYIPPLTRNEVEGKRARIRAYMREQFSQRLKVFKGGKRKGQFGKKGRRNDQLQRRHLIVQARRRKKGLKGLYGPAMRRAAGKLSGQAQRSVGFLKSLFIPILRTLNEVARFRKVSLTKLKNISVWPGGSGSGWARWATPGFSPKVILRVVSRARHPVGDQGQQIITAALTRAFSAEAAELRRHVERKLARRAGQAPAPSPPG